MSPLSPMSQSTFEDVRSVVTQTLGIEQRADRLEPSTGLLGNVPEFDSFAVVEVVAALEERFGIVVDDEDVTADIFETFGDLSAFVERKLRS